MDEYPTPNSNSLEPFTVCSMTSQWQTTWKRLHRKHAMFADNTTEFGLKPLSVTSTTSVIEEPACSSDLCRARPKPKTGCRKWRSHGKRRTNPEIETRNLGHGFVYRAGEVAQVLELDTSSSPMTISTASTSDPALRSCTALSSLAARR